MVDQLLRDQTWPGADRHAAQDREHLDDMVHHRKEGVGHIQVCW